MIILSEAQPYGFNLLEEIRKFNHSNKKVKVYTFFHGSFGTKTRNNKTNKTTYATDIDIDCWMYFQNNKDELLKHGLNLIEFLLKKNLYFDKTVCGEDSRFNFEAYIEKNGEVKNYDAKKIKKQIQKLKKDKIITENDEKDLLEYIIDKPTLISFEKFKRVLEKYLNISWSLDDLRKGEVEHYKKKFYLKDMFMKYVMKNTLIYEYKLGSYILFDIPFKVFDISEEYQNKLTDYEYPELYNILNSHANLYGENDKTGTLYLYEGIFKNYVQEKYLKMLKRFNSLLGINIFNETNNTKLNNKQYQSYLKLIRGQLKRITKSQEMSCLNQLKNRCDIIVSLIENKYKDEMEIKRLVMDLMKDAMYSCNYKSPDIKTVYEALKTFHMNNSNNNKNKLIDAIKLFKKNMFRHLNMLALPHLIHFYNELKSKNLLVFNLTLPLPKD